MANYTLDFGPTASGIPVLTIFRDINTGANITPPTLTGLVSGYVDFSWTSGQSIHFRAELTSVDYIAGNLDPRDTLPLGEGSVEVNHNYGGTDALRLLEIDTSQPVDNAFLYFFIQSDFDAVGLVDKNSQLKATTTTNSDGRWTSSVWLDPATYTMLVIKSNATPKTFTVNVT